MLSIPTLVTLLLFAAPRLVQASPCVTFDSQFNLHVLGLNGKDWNAGQQDTWSSGQATDITGSGRPPFDGTTTTCYLNQFGNVIYVLNGDSSKPSAIHIYDVGAKSWSTQNVNGGDFDPNNFGAILDHDTNVFYAVSKNSISFVNMGEGKAAGPDLSWTVAKDTPYGGDYKPVMALARNHIHFIDVPGTPAGSANIFVIHFSFFQAEAQSYPNPAGQSFPAAQGKTASIFQPDGQGVQQEFAFIPADGSNTFIVNVDNNSTRTMPGPSNKDPNAQYAASPSSLVQLASDGSLSFISYKQGDFDANAKASWASVAKVAAVAPPTNGGGPGTTPNKPNAPNAPNNNNNNQTDKGDKDNNGAVAAGVRGGLVFGGLVAAVASLVAF